MSCTLLEVSASVECENVFRYQNSTRLTRFRFIFSFTDDLVKLNQSGFRAELNYIRVKMYYNNQSAITLGMAIDRKTSNPFLMS